MSGEAEGSDTLAVKPVVAKRPALGRGLGALLGETRREEAVSRISVSAPADGNGPQVAVVMQRPICSKLTKRLGQGSLHAPSIQLANSAPHVGQHFLQ